MLPVDGRQLENVKGELLKLKKKEAADCQLWHNVARTEEQRNSRLSDMAQRGQERRAEETEEQRNRRSAVMGQRSQQRRAEETEEQRKENTFWGERNVHVSDNICKKNKSEAGI
ncbi:hypothetical protein AVEN_98099-1 [Araneus ventricosus]|uniref:STPR domain-containing protein n=1 Tax=Araneus ventricosus TaxID=182803 RepID=A0A4Y2L6F7_ARAVE|nr:hypothetical protein AVEN_98099-1 [Araneus ventricosus]